MASLDYILDTLLGPHTSQMLAAKVG